MRWWENVLKKKYINTTRIKILYLTVTMIPWATTHAAMPTPPPPLSSPIIPAPKALMTGAAMGGGQPTMMGQSTPAMPTQSGAGSVSISDEETGIQGNWLKKKDWLTRAYELNDEIKLILVDIQMIRESFSTKYNQIDKELDTYYKDMGLSQGILNELFVSMEKYLEKRKTEAIKFIDELPEEEKPSEREREIQVSIIDEKMALDKVKLKQLKLDMKSIEDLDKSLNDRLKKMNDQIVLALDLEKQGKQFLDTIWHVIDHNKAETLYYKIKNEIVEKLKGIQTYLKTKLSQDFDNVITTIKQQIEKTKQQTNDIEQDGLVIKDRAARIEHIKKEKLERAKAAQLLAQQEAAQTKHRRRRVQPKSWYSHVVDWTASLINAIKSPFTWLFGHSQPPARKRQLKPATAADGEIAPQPKPAIQQVPHTLPVINTPSMPGVMPVSPAPSMPGALHMPMEHESR